VNSTKVSSRKFAIIATRAGYTRVFTNTKKKERAQKDCDTLRARSEVAIDVILLLLLPFWTRSSGRLPIVDDDGRGIDKREFDDRPKRRTIREM